MKNSAGGVAIAITTIIGGIVGIRIGEPTLGTLIGLGAGLAIAAAYAVIVGRR